MKPGDIVHTSFGKGIVREVRNSGRVLAEVKGRAMELGPDQVSPAEPSNPKAKRREEHARPEDPQPGDSSSLLSVPEVDLHGLTVDEALARAALALNNAILANVPALRFIHGRSGGRIRGALQRWLGSVAAVRGFRLDPPPLASSFSPHTEAGACPACKGLGVEDRLDPALLVAGPKLTRDATRSLLAAMPARGHIVNLGHGITPDASLDSVHALIETVHAEQTS